MSHTLDHPDLARPHGRPQATLARLALALALGVLGISLAGHGPLASAIHDPLFGSAKTQKLTPAKPAFPPALRSPSR